MAVTTRPKGLLLLGRDALTETWLCKGGAPEAAPARTAVRLVRGAFHRDPRFAAKLARVASTLRLERGSSVRSEDAVWAAIEAALLRRQLSVQEHARPPRRADPGSHVKPSESPPPPVPPAPIVEENRALFIVRCDPELLDDSPLGFEYMIRGLAGQQVTLRILSESFPGKLVHERPLTPSETEDRVHADTWDGIVTVGKLQGRRLPAEYGPCVLEIVHDDTYRDEAEFTLSRIVVTFTLDGFFHTGSAMFLPSRPARGGIVAPRPFAKRDQLDEWIGEGPHEAGPELDEPFDPPPWYEPRETIGPSLLAHILDECGGTHSQRGLILAGHTNAAGSNALNDELSDARARNVWSLLTGDAEGFESALEDFWILEDAYVILRYCALRHAWPCDPGDAGARPTPAYRDAVREFQSRYNVTFEAEIAVDGVVGPQTRGAFFEVYQAVLTDAFGGQSALQDHRTRLRVHGATPAFACGERYPSGARRPGQGLDDRRVEALLFLPDEAVPGDAAAIYAHDTFRFAEWSPDSGPHPQDESTEQELEPIEPSPEPTDGGELHVYEPVDPDDPWDFLNAIARSGSQPGGTPP